VIPVEVKDIDDKVDFLIDEILDGKQDQDICKIASEVLSQKKDGQWVIPERDWKGEVGALFKYVRKNVRYTRDIANIEVFRRPGRTLELKIGDCDDMTILLGSLLGAVGYPVIIRVIGRRGMRVFEHVYLLAGIPPHDPTDWIPLDASRPEAAGWELPADQVGMRRDYLVEEE